MPDSRENKVSVVLRVLLSFVLFALVVVISLAFCAKMTVLNKDAIVDRFASYEYVSEVKNSTVQYVSDVYVRNGLDCDKLNDIIDDELVRDSVKTYIAGNIGSENVYNEITYTESVDGICDSVESDIRDQIKLKGLEYNESKVSEIKESVNSYLLNEIEVGFSGLKTAMNVGAIATTVIISVGAFFALAAFLILVFIGKVRYRSVRAAGISFYAAGFYEIIISIMVFIIFKFKHLDIFPIYLRELVMDCIYSCAGSITAAGFTALLAGLIISVAVWKMKRGK
ncbi:MAG TPA: hypothetical protein IAA24_04780 [Candidatus Eubacterium faecigallinarum]|nr:hypothetical protein [Candidatus Eubacterium faecigallinarum]